MNTCARDFGWLLLLLALSATAVAQSGSRGKAPCAAPDQITAVPNRPTFSTTAETVQCGVFEIEYGMNAADGHQDVNGLLKFGVLKNLELRFSNLPLTRDNGVAAFGDVGAGFKYRFLSQHKTTPTLALLYTAVFPTAGHGLGLGTTGHFITALASKDFGKNHFDWNEAVQFIGRPGIGGFDHNYFSALDYVHPLSKKWSGAVEIAGYSSLNASTPASMTLLAGASYSVTPRLVLDCGAYYGVFGNIPRVNGFAGVTYSVGDFYHRHQRRRPASAN